MRTNSKTASSKKDGSTNSLGGDANKAARLGMEGMIHKAVKVLTHLIPEGIKNEAERGRTTSKYQDKLGDYFIPAGLVRHAKGVVFLTVIKTGLLVSVQGGTGILIARDKDGGDSEYWSGPVAVGVGGLGVGFSFGASKTDVVLILNSHKAVRAFTGNAQLKLGVDLQVAAGPVGRDADVSLLAGKGIAPVYSYSYSKGLFVGATLDGAVMWVRGKQNKQFYDDPKVTAKQIIEGDVHIPHSDELLALRNRLKHVASLDPLENLFYEEQDEDEEDDDWEAITDNETGLVYWWNRKLEKRTALGASKPVSEPKTPATNA